MTAIEMIRQIKEAAAIKEAEAKEAAPSGNRTIAGMMNPTPTMLKAYESGKTAGSKFDSLRAFWAAVSHGEADAPGYLSEPGVLMLFWEAGFCGHDIPRWVNAVRIGALPADGRSMNYAEQRFESGVSVLKIEGEARSDNGTFDLFNTGSQVRVSGWLHFRRGSDGEPLLVGAVES